MANMDKMAIMAVMAWLHMAINTADIGGFAKNRENAAVKVELKNLHWFKSDGQNKINSEIMAISFVFSPHFCPKLTTLEEALPMGPQSSSLCFWNPWNM